MPRLDRQLHCRLGHRFELHVPAGQRRRRSSRYHATLRRAGVDIGFNQQVVVAWAVFAPTRGVARGDLAGNYGGAAASATVGVGVGANALIGGSNNTIALQPLSVQAQTGLSVAAGVAGLELRAGR